MRHIIGLLLVGSVALVACSGDDSGGLRVGGPATTPGATTPAPGEPGATPSSTPGAVAVACPATVPAATALDATDLNAICALAQMQDSATTRAMTVSDKP